MKTATVTEFRKNMKDHLTNLKNDQDILVLTGPKNMNFVVITLETFNSMEETTHLLSSRANARHLMDSIDQFTAGKVIIKRLDDLQDSKPTKSNHPRITRKSVKISSLKK